MNKTKKILIVDDDTNICELLRLYIEKDGFDTAIAYNGTQALKLFEQDKPDLVMLDIMLPELDGWQVCREIRKTSQVPVIMLTAKGDDMDKILGLEYGADDYITKPFNILEVKARIKAIIRRSSKKNHKESDGLEVYGSLKVDSMGKRVYIKDKEISLTTREYELLSLLVRNPRKIYSRDNLLHEVWGAAYPGDARTVDVHIRRLREKIEETPSDPAFIHTKWGVGYYFENKE